MTSGEALKRYAFHFAAYGRYLRGVDEDGNAYSIDDPIADELKKKGTQIYTQQKGSLVLEISAIFGPITQYPDEFKAEVDKWYSKISEEGVESGLREMLGKW